MMKGKLWILATFFLAFSLFLGVGLTIITQPPLPVAAQTGQTTDDLATIEVSGHGQVQAEPDQAVVRLGVQTEADTAEAALEENNERMTAVISATIEAGIEESDITTEGFRLQPVYETSTNGQSRELVGYQANNMVRVMVSDLQMLGALLDTAVTAGSNNIQGIEFQISNREELEAEAREAAINNAQEKAEQLTQLAGADLGPVHSIIEVSGGGPLPFALADQAAAESSVPIQAGTMTIQANVQVVWEIR
ncbi:MAG: SIMPL domain-containing protein [Anaerolineaceae bacterium]|nr:SIMPL domain-containing protein [Anaerolineaceae bacterium]